MRKKIVSKILLLTFIITFFTNSLSVKVVQATLGGEKFIEKVAVSKNKVVTGESITIRVKSKNVHDYYRMELTYLLNGSKQTFYLELNDSTGYYEENVSMEWWSKYGKYVPSHIDLLYLDKNYNEDSIRIYDVKSGIENQKYYYDLSPLTFEAIDTGWIEEYVHSLDLSVDVGSIITGQVAKYTLISTDNISKIISGKIVLENKKTKQRKNITLKKSGSTFKGELSVDNTYSNGIYNVREVHLSLNNNSNIIIYDEQKEGMYYRGFNVPVQVTNTGIDLSSIKTNRTKYKANEWINVTAKRNRYEKQGNNKVIVEFRSNNDVISCILSPNGDVFEGSVLVNEENINGDYKVSNVASYLVSEQWDMFNLNITSSINSNMFSIYGEIKDTTPPILQSLSMDKNSIKQGEKVKITAKATDDISGVASITLVYDYLRIELIENNGVFYGEKYATTADIPRVYKLNYIIVTDKAGNSNQINNSFIKGKNIEIIKNLNAPMPIINKIEVNKSTISQGEGLIVTAEMVNYSPELAVNIILSSNKLKKNVDLKLKYKNGKYVGTLDIDKNMDRDDWHVKKIEYEYYYNERNNMIEIESLYNKRYKDDGIVVKYINIDQCDFKVIGSLDPEFFMTSSEAIFKIVVGNQVINGDYYISENSKTIIEGTLDVKGKLIVQGQLINKGKINANNGIYAMKQINGNKNDDYGYVNGLLVNAGGSLGTSKVNITTNMLPTKYNIDKLNGKTILHKDKENKVDISGVVSPNRYIKVNEDNMKISSIGKFGGTVHFDGDYDDVKILPIEIKDTYGNMYKSNIRCINEKFDVSKDGAVDLKDLSTIASSYNQLNTSEAYNINKDFNKDGIIDIFDLISIARVI